MGVTFRTYVVAGVKAKDAIRVDTPVRKVTKYDEDTGEPYEKEVSGPTAVYLFGVAVPGVTAKSSPEDLLHALLRGRRSSKVEVFSEGGDPDDRVYIFGVEIARLDPCDEPFQLDDDTLARGRGAARLALDGIGYNHGVHAPIGIYVIHYAG